MQEPKYVKTSDGRTARVIASFNDNYVDYYVSIRLKTNIEKRDVAHGLVDLLGQNIYSDILNEVIDFLEILYLREKKRIRKIKDNEGRYRWTKRT